MAELRVSKAAEQDIREIGRYTQRRWGRAQRYEYLAALGRTLEVLAVSPLLAPERLEFDPPVRIFPYARHLIVYRVEASADEPRRRAQGVFVVRVLHKRMDVPTQLAKP